MSDTNQNSQSPDRGPDGLKSAGPFIPKSAREALKPERLPQPPKRSRKSRSQLVVFLNFIMTLIVMATLAAGAGAYYALTQYQQPGPLVENTNFIAKPGAGVSDIATSLERNGIISDARIFRYLTLAYLRNGDTLKAGEYEIKAGASMREIMELLKSGKSILYSITFPEGLTSKQMIAKLREEPTLEGDLPAALPAEGTLQPDTYKYTRGRQRSEILKQMLTGQQQLVDEIWATRDPDSPLASKEEMVTLASIVEKETGKADERPLVASVFVNRLKKGMRLQSDPTIIYGLFGGDGKPADRAIFKSDLEKATPYNTYMIDGLPPTPIASPGRASLEAVANPAKTSNLYFVADGTGGHVFAATLQEHNANVKRWRAIKAGDGSDATDAAADDEQPAEQPKKKKKKTN